VIHYDHLAEGGAAAGNLVRRPRHRRRGGWARLVGRVGEAEQPVDLVVGQLLIHSFIRSFIY